MAPLARLTTYVFRQIPDGDVYRVGGLVTEQGYLCFVGRYDHGHNSRSRSLRLYCFLEVRNQLTVSDYNRTLAYLCSPPPFPRMHVMEKPDSAIGIRIVTLGQEHQVWDELRVAEERA